MATANFEIGNKEFEVRFIHESGYPHCIPYNEETVKLIGTTDEWKGDN